MLKNIARFWFCTDKFRYLAAEKVLWMAFNSSERSRTDIYQSSKASYELLTDKIF